MTAEEQAEILIRAAQGGAFDDFPLAGDENEGFEANEQARLDRVEEILGEPAIRIALYRARHHCTGHAYYTLSAAYNATFVGRGRGPNEAAAVSEGIARLTTI